MVPLSAKWHMLKITRSRFIWLLCGAALIGAVSIAAARVATLMLADDAQTCRQHTGDTAIAACSRAIASGRYQGRGLARILSDRALEYRRKGDGRAMDDYNAAIRVDPQYVHALIGRGFAWQDRRDYDRAIAD
jgi:hypothetical protein